MQLNYDYFTTPECKILKSKVQTNPRYKNFTQLYYTVGDTEQFWVARNLKKSIFEKVLTEPQISKDNLFLNIDTFIPFPGYKNISDAQVEDTFNYIFHKFKKGIYIRLKNGQLESFIPFSKAFFVNEWFDHVKINPKYKSMENFFKVQHDLTNRFNNTNYKFNINRINLNPSFWFANNCILRYENPVNEEANNYAQIKSMFLELCAERHVPDMEFFVNRRDFPILTRNGTEPYNNIYGDDEPLKSYKFEKYLPILSMCTSEKFADVAIPTHEDWARIKSDEGIYFPYKCRNYNFKFNLNWESKKNIAVFRGSNTGCGFNLENNARLKLAKLGTLYPQFLNVGITNWNLRIRKNKGSKYLEIPDIGNLKLVAKLSPEEQSNYKYLINVDGHVAAFRLSLELSMGCCILMVESTERWKMWFSGMLKPYFHYIPIKSDFSNLIDQIQWCRDNDYKCKLIAQNALNFYNKFLTKKGVLDNLEKTLFKLRDEMYPHGYPSPQIDPLLLQMDMEHFILINSEKKERKITGLFPRNTGRNYGTLKGLEMFIQTTVKPEEQITFAGVEVQTLFKSKTTQVLLYQIGAEYIIVKKTIDAMKKIETIHEAFIGKFVINQLLKICPNFVYTLDYRDEPFIVSESDYVSNYQSSYTFKKEVSVLQEYINGPTLQEFLKNCTFKSFLEIILSLCCALIVAYKNCGFIHHDLKPWNIIVNILPEPIILEYYLGTDSEDVVYKIKTRFIPVIIDYGKSHVIYKNIHHGIVEPFSTNKNIDLIMLLISTINELLLRQKENNDLEDLIFLANFLSKKEVSTDQDLKYFINKTKKFGNLNYQDLKTQVNIYKEFFKYMVPLTKKYKISFGKANLSLNIWHSNPTQIFEMSLGLDTEEKVNSYLNVIRRIYKNPMPQASNKFTTIMIAQKILNGLTKPKIEFIEFASYHNLNKIKVENILKEFNKMEKFLMDFYTTQINRKTSEIFDLGINHELYEKILNFQLRPSRSLFLGLENEKDKIHHDLENFPKFKDYGYYRSLIMDVLRDRGPFKLQDEDKKFYMDNFKLLFNDKFISKIVDIETIRFYLKYEK